MKILETHPDGAPACVEIAGIAFVRAVPNNALVGLDRLPEVMRDGAAPAQIQDIATMTDTNTDHGGAVEVERYIDGRLDLTHAPSLGTFIGKTLASFVSRNNMPEISGDNRKRIPEHERRRYDPACVRLAEEILAALHPTPQTDTDAREKVVEALRRLEVLRDQARNGTPVTDPNEWEADELDGILAALKTGDA